MACDEQVQDSTPGLCYSKASVPSHISSSGSFISEWVWRPSVPVTVPQRRLSGGHEQSELFSKSFSFHPNLINVLTYGALLLYNMVSKGNLLSDPQTPQIGKAALLQSPRLSGWKQK